MAREDYIVSHEYNEIDPRPTGREQRLAAFKAFREYVMSVGTDDMEAVWREAHRVAYDTARRLGASTIMAEDYARRAREHFHCWINSDNKDYP